MTQRLTLATAALLTVPPLMWAGNAIVGRIASEWVPPATLNLLRWVLAFAILLPITAWVLKPGSVLWTHWRRYALLGFLGVGLYNALQYLALRTSTPINVTLVAASTPVFMLLIGWMFYGQKVSRRQIFGALLSITGVLVVLARGQLELLMQLRLAPGDLYVLIATVSWAFYSWQLTRPGDPPELRNDWAAFLMAQMVFGIGWGALFAGGEWALTDAHIVWGWPTIATLLYVAICPAILAYRCWGLGVQRVGPTVAAFFANLTPLIAALLSTTLLGQAPTAHHVLAFVLIVGGIVVSSRRG